jgi:hypothetical protein
MRFLKINNVLIQSSLAFWHQGTAQRVLMFLATTILFMPSTLAKSLDEYCVSRIGQKPKPTKVVSYADKNQKQVTIRTASGLYDVSIDHSDLVLTRKGSSTRLSEVKVPPYNYSPIIESITLTKNQWLWADGFEIDYMIAVNTSATLPTFGKPTLFPKIFSHPCSMFSDFFGSCLLAQGIYSKTLERAFVEGHRVNFFGFSEPVSFEMMEGTVKPLPKPLQGARFVADVPQLKGALFRGAFDEALFYDGLKVTTLIKGSSAQRTDNSIPNWYWITLSDQRTYLTNFDYIVNNKFLMELKIGPALKSIDIPDELNKGGLKFFSHKQDSRLWGIGLYKVVAERRGRLHTLIKINEPSFIDSLKGTGQALDGTLSFTVKNPKTKSSTQYFVAKNSPKSQCKTTLNFNKPIFIGS